LITVLIVAMTSIFFSLLGFINAVYANSFDDISIIPTFVLTPLIYLGGVFYSTDMLPEFWGMVSQINPILYIVNAFRYGVLGLTDINIAWSFAMIITFTLIAYFYSMHLLNTGKRLRQ
ncbi:ABC transporter permease, partial [bacterium AH-315-K03]|nr:ABC transporter permease [bacterium AH-315-K03]